MTPYLLQFLCEPKTKAPLRLVGPVYDESGAITSGFLEAPSGRRYAIINGIPRFADDASMSTVESFGDEWNHFNFVDFKANWLAHTVANTFGSPEVFKGRLIVDAGGGSGAQSKWFAEYGAAHVIMMDLSHSVDVVVRENLAGLANVDVIQCSIDAPPLRDESVDGIVYCHNVIQHTPSVEETAQALFAIVAPGSEFVFNCYAVGDQGLARWIRWHIFYMPIRRVLSKMPFTLILLYARMMAFVRLIPGVGYVVEKSGFCLQGDVPRIPGESLWKRSVRRFRATSLNTFDIFGSHSFQHHKTDKEIMALVGELQQDTDKIVNTDKYFARPQNIGAALRIFK